MNTNVKNEIRINSIHGHIYQLKVLMLFLYRGVSREYCFRLGTEIKEAEKFDDLLFEYIKDNIKIYKLLQAKHKFDESKKITTNQLLCEYNGDYNLIKYFLSYQNSKKRPLFKDGIIHDVIIYTNINFSFESLKNANIRVTKIEDFNDIFYVKSNHKQSVCYKFDENIAPLIYKKLQDHEQIKCVKSSEYSVNSIKDFLNHLVFAVNQPNEDELGKIIKNEMSKEFRFVSINNLYNAFFHKTLDFLMGKSSDCYLTYEEVKKFLERESGQISPIWFNVEDPSESFIGRTKELNILHNKLQYENRIVAITGPGGVGKSELVKKYISMYSQNYDHKIIWIDSETKQSCEQSFRRLINNQFQIIAEDGKSMDEIFYEILKCFVNSKCLFIFNPHPSSVQSFMRFFHSCILHCLSGPEFKEVVNVYILIISPDITWPDSISCLQLDKFHYEESIEFIKSSLGTTLDNEERLAIHILVKELKYIPLALQHAVNYIKVQYKKLNNTGLSSAINVYRNIFNKKMKILSRYTFEEIDSCINRLIFVTWDIILDSLQQEDNSDNAIEILNITSYLLCGTISMDIFRSLVNDDKKYNFIVDLFIKYSILNKQDINTIKICKLVRKITNIKLKNQNSEMKILSKALKLFNKDTINTENIYHAIDLGLQCRKFMKFIKEYIVISSYVICKLIDNCQYAKAYNVGSDVFRVINNINNFPIAEKIDIIDKYHDKSKYNIVMIILTEISNILKIFFRPDHPANLYTKFTMAQISAKQDKCVQALDLFQYIYSYQNNLLGESHPDTLLTKDCIAKVFTQQGNYDNAVQKLEEVYNIKKLIFGDNHADCLLIKERINKILSDKNRHSKIVQLYDDSLYCLETIFQIYSDGMLIVRWNRFQNNNTSHNPRDDALLHDERKFNENASHCSEERHIDSLCQYIFMTSIHLMQSTYDDVHKFSCDLFSINDDVDRLHVSSRDYILAVLCEYKGTYLPALRLYKSVLINRQQILGHDHGATLKVQSSIASVLSKQEKYCEAHKLYSKIYQIQSKCFGESHIDTLKTMVNIGMMLYGGHLYDRALNILEKTCEKLKFYHCNATDILTRTKSNIASVLAAQKKYDKALKIFNEVYTSQIVELGIARLYARHTKCKIAITLFEQGKNYEALRNFQELYEMYKNDFGPEHKLIYFLDKHIKSILDETEYIITIVKNNQLHELKHLILNHDSNINIQCSQNLSLLHYAVKYGHVDMVNFLLDYEVDMLLVDKDGNTPLHYAVSIGHIKIIEKLLYYTPLHKLNDFINTKNIVGGTASIHIAAEKNFFDIVKLLLQRGAIFNIEDNEGRTPRNLSNDPNIILLLQIIGNLFENAKIGNSQIIYKLKSLKSDEFIIVLNARNEQRYTLLDVTVTNGYILADRLLEISTIHNQMLFRSKFNYSLEQYENIQKFIQYFGVIFIVAFIIRFLQKVISNSSIN